LHEDFRPQQLGRFDDADFGAVDFDLRRVVEPFVGDGDLGGAAAIDDVEEVFVVVDFRDPALVLALQKMSKSFVGRTMPV
jgi:hypothetical protein